MDYFSSYELLNALGGHIQSFIGETVIIRITRQAKQTVKRIWAVVTDLRSLIFDSDAFRYIWVMKFEAHVGPIAPYFV